MNLFRTASIAAAYWFAASGAAFAQDKISGLVENGSNGFSGMFAGLLVVALAALGLRHRRHEELLERFKRMEAALEARDDEIWQLQEKLARAEKLADAQGYLVVREDMHGHVTHVSESLCALLRQDTRDVVSWPLSLDVVRETNRIDHTDGSVTYDQEIETPAGRRWIAWKEVAITDHAGEVAEVQRAGHDITARINWEQALADASERAESASRAKSRFLAVVSHEVRTPLNGVLGMANLLLDSGLSPEQQTYAKSIKTSGEALLGLIEEILDFSKIEAGRLDLETVPFDVAGLVTDVVELLAPRAQAKGIEIAAEIADDVPARVFGDAARLRQVLLNLAGNAVKFTDEGGVLVVVERDADNRIKFVVEDSGPGVGPDAQERIFREFEQGDDSAARRHGGTGLGLAIASRIVERMGGRISLASHGDRGSVFDFSIELPADKEAGAPFQPADLTGQNVLIASPSPVTGPALERKLVSWGADVTLTSDPRVAETLLPERDWSRVFVDRSFGAEETRLLAQAAKARGRELYVLLSPADRHELAKLRSAGFNGYLVKPLRAASLAAQLAAAQIEAPAADQHAPGGSLPRDRALAVLIAEDNDINALLAQATLGKLGHIPAVVGDGVSAVKAVASAHEVGAPFDLVLMDLHLPGMDGLEATRRIRALDGAGSVPIIALTANASNEDREACLAAGMDAFVVKPFDRDTLEEAIASARGMSAKRAANAA
ncbi:MAG TPA: ATP-binding protein [Xanthobacteraceae bacterium]|nr:ATP-binding protein [Xanthobacteraceae bacterium]